MADEYLSIPKPDDAVGLDNSFYLAAEEAAPASLLAFRAGGWGFCLPISLHCEVIEAMPVNPIPLVEPWFSGLLNIRGNIVPVADLCLLPGAAIAAPKKRYLLALGQGGKMMVLWIDSYPQMLASIDGQLQTMPQLPPQLLPCIDTAYQHLGQIWLSARFDALFKTLGTGRTNIGKFA